MHTKRSNATRNLTLAAMIAALYVVLTYISHLFGLDSGAIQLRLSEALTILPVFSASTIPALTIGCLLAILIGLISGSPLGWLDLIVGTSATLVSALLSYRLRNIRWKGLPVLSTLPPVLCNALFVGLELTFALHGGFLPAMFGWYALTVGLGQAVACIGLGLPLYALIRSRRLDRFFE